MMMPSGVAGQYNRPNPVGGDFGFIGPRGVIRSAGQLVPVETGTQDMLDACIARAFQHAGAGAIIGGALPFDQCQNDHLWCAERSVSGALPATASPPVTTTLGMSAAPSRQDYAGSVSMALDAIRRDAALQHGLRKVVLTRTLAVNTADPISVAVLIDRLTEDDSVTAFQVALPSKNDAPRHRVGATPELLIEKRGSAILSNPLAGSIRRCADPSQDAEACAGLARSDKDRREHAMVVEYILDQLSPWCRQLGCPDGTRLTSTRSMWHLHTRISGELSDETVLFPFWQRRCIPHPPSAACPVSEQPT